MPRRFPDDPRPFEVLDRKYLFRRPPWLVLRQDHLRLPTGGEIPEYWISEYPPWVNVVAVTAADEVVLIRQYRPGIDDVHFEIPAGVVDGARRGHRDRRPARAGRGDGLRRRPLVSAVTLSANPALTTNLTYTYLAEGVTPLGAAAPEATEDLRVHLVPVAQIAGLIDAQDMIQALHVAPLLRYLLRLNSS